MWRLPNTLEFFSDIGRDHFVLLRSVQTHKPPLLGPSNSALPLNQSPIYYYLNVPVFLLSGYSAYTTFITLILLSVGVFTLLFLFFGTHKNGIKLLYTIILLVTFHPQFVIQSRYPWNPTFTVPFLLLSIFLLLLEWKQKRYIWGFSLAVAIAVGCSYSVIPTVVVLVGYVIWKKKCALRDLLISLLSSFTLVFLPLFIVELRTHFLVTKRMLLELHLVGNHIDYLFKLKSFFAYMIGTEAYYLWPTILVLFVIVVCFFSKPKPQLFWPFILSAVLTIFSPFPLGTHYIFGVTILFFFTVATMRNYIRVPLLIFFLVLWIPQLYKELGNVPHRTIPQLETCAKQVCQNEHVPLYVSEQAWHSYHYAPDWLFFLAKNGCSVADVTQSPGFAERMAVVVDQSSYEHGKTAYNELTLFGSSTVDTAYSCDGNISVVMLQKSTP